MTRSTRFALAMLAPGSLPHSVPAAAQAVGTATIAGTVTDSYEGVRMYRAFRSVAVTAVLLLLPALAQAQATLSGTVRDGSGAVLPGVTVVASSDALIEKTRTVVTDSTGQYRIVDLRTGVYSLTFTLAGFAPVRREGIELEGSAIVTVPAELRVGGLEETVTVTAEIPVLNVQSAEREFVFRNDVISSLPISRSYSALLTSIPGMNVANGDGVSSDTTLTSQNFSARGGAANEGRMTVNGLTVAATGGGGGISNYAYNMFDAAEMQVRISGGLGEAETGGPRVNIVPRSGGNNFAGSAFLNLAGDWARADNIDDELRALGFTASDSLKKAWDTSGSLGGPVKRDRLWFYGTVRQFGTTNVNATGTLPNLFAGDPTQWGYAPDTSVTESRTMRRRDSYQGRLTGQLGKQRISFSHELQKRCDGSTLTPSGEGCRQRGSNWIALGNATTSPEAHAGIFTLPYLLSQANWTRPQTSRLLMEGGYSRLSVRTGMVGEPPSDGFMNLINVVEQAAVDGHRANLSYRAINNHSTPTQVNHQFNGSLAYVTGAHNMKVGYQGGHLISDTFLHTNETLVRYRFNRGVPNQFTIQLPNWETANRTASHSLYVQDSWTRNRLTMQGALRYDHAHSWHPSEANGTGTTSPFNPQPIRFERTVSVRGFQDVSPRLGLAYDVFGTGNTALKFNAGRYVTWATNGDEYVVNNPANRIQTTLARNWTDNDNDKVIDCNILNFAAQSPATGTVDTCPAVGGNNANFANALTGLDVVNPATLGGYGVRPYDWQMGLAVQHQIVSRVSLEVAYNRRWWGNFTVTDNQSLAPGDYEKWVATAPVDPRLPGGGGYPIDNYLVRPEAFSRPAQNYITFEEDFGPSRINYWHGVEVTANARMRNGLTFQGGTSTGREVEDRCETVVKIDSPNPRNCRTVDPFRTTFRGSTSYTVPKVDVLVSGILRITPADELGATLLFPNSVVLAQLGHLPAGATATGTQNVNLLNDNQLYADERNVQLDMRFAKILRIAGRRLDVGIDLYNLLNANTPTGYEDTYDPAPAAGLGQGGEWLRPTGIASPRFARLNLTMRF
jgi:hypothetical protein